MILCYEVSALCPRRLGIICNAGIPRQAMVQALAVLLVIQLPVNMPCKAVQDGLSTWVSASIWEIQVEFQAPGFDLV